MGSFRSRLAFADGSLHEQKQNRDGKTTLVTKTDDPGSGTRTVIEPLVKSVATGVLLSLGPWRRF
jgi:hypothetical protein